MIQYLFLHAADANTWKYVPAVMQRIVAFIEKYEHGKNPSEVLRHLQESFISANPTMLSAIVLKDGDPIGHVLFETVYDHGVRSMYITQIELDELIPRETIAKYVEFTAEILRGFGVTRMLAITRNKAVARALRRWWGMSEAGVFMRRDLPPPPGKEMENTQ